jgi:amino acid adenylation domain-containing protein
MLEDSGAPVLLTQARLLDELPAHDATALCLDRDGPRIAEAPSANPAVTTRPDDLAYMIYTSGSTGQPKGALLPHRGLCSLSETQARAFDVTPDSRVLQFSSLSFDASTFEIVMALPKGATLVLGDREDLMPGPDLVALLRRHAVSIVTLPPSALGACPVETLPDLTTVTVAGEACPAELVARWAPGRRFFNLYGPTETTIWATMAALHDGETPSIGRPIANTRVYVVDERLQPVPVGAPGELCIGGLGLARGYHARPALTAERFVPNPFADAPGARLYRTGDLVRYRADGTIEFLGRIDHQVKVRGFRIELGEIEEVLTQNPLVREAVVTSRNGAVGGDELVAYVAPDRDASDAQAGEHVGQWQALYDETYGEQIAPDDPTFNIAGWNSSYTGEPIPASEMLEWVDGTVSRVLAMQPRRVLELGCGSGLLLFRIAPHCEAYVGTDFSQAALAYVSRHLEGRGLSSKVELRRRTADDFTDLEAGSYDTVILNSVMQYFPSVEYALAVLDGAIRLVKPGGRIFVGDVRSLPLLAAYHASVQLFRSEDATTAVDLRRRVHRLLAQEEELVVDPALFLALAQRRDELSHVEIRPKRGRARNELSKFRYDVTLHVGGTAPEPLRASSEDWSGPGLDVTRLRERLESERPEVVALRGVPNARTAGDAATASMVLDGEEELTAERIRERSPAASRDGVDPDTMCALGEGLGYRVELSWANAGTDGRYGALLVRDDAPAHAAMPLPRLPVRAWTSYANSPVQSKLTRQLTPALREYLESRLPRYMVPSAFVMLEALPLTPNGKVNLNALPDPVWYRSQAASSYEAPRTQAETDLAEIWGELLGVDRVGIRDDFFELGGHSLLATQVVSRVRETMGVDLPVAELFTSSTVAALAEEIETLRWAATGDAPPGASRREVEEGAI